MANAVSQPNKKRLSLWLMCGAMILIVALKEDRVGILLIPTLAAKYWLKTPLDY